MHRSATDLISPAGNLGDARDAQAITEVLGGAADLYYDGERSAYDVELP